MKIRRKHYLASLALSCLAMIQTSAWVSHPSSSRRQRVEICMEKNLQSEQISAQPQSPATRRSILTSMATLLISTPALAVMDVKEEGKVFQPGQKLTVDEAKERFKLARKDVQYLLDNYAKVCEGGGDNVRRYIGTVGVQSYMYGIRKVVKELRDEADDIVEYTEAMNEFEAYLNQAEGAAYQSLFVEHSSAKGTPESFLATAKEDVKQMLKYMDELAVQLGIQV